MLRSTQFDILFYNSVNKSSEDEEEKESEDEEEDEEVAYFSKRDVFMANIYFSPMIETTLTVIENSTLDYRLPRIHIVPMTVDSWMIKGEEKDWEKYKSFMTDLLGYLCKENKSHLDTDIERIVELEMELAEIHNKSKVTSSDSWEMVGMDELHNYVPTVEWEDFIQKSLSANKEFMVQRWTKVAIPSVDLMKKMGKWIKKIEVDRRDQANLFVWRMMVTFSRKFMHTSEGSFVNIFKKIDPKAKTRSENCLTQIKTFFHGVEDQLIIAEYLDTETKTYMYDQWKNLKKAFGEIIRESTWMTKRTRLRAEEKLKKTKMNIGRVMPVTEEFRKLKDDMSLNYISNILAIGNYQWDTQAQTLGNSLKEASETEASNNAFYDAGVNELTVMTGLIEGMVELGFSRFFPPSVIYGGFIASTLGHELTHGFDSTGRKYDGDGYDLDWWEPDDIDAFNYSMKCMVRALLRQSNKKEGRHCHENCKVHKKKLIMKLLRRLKAFQAVFICSYAIPLHTCLWV